MLKSKLSIAVYCVKSVIPYILWEVNSLVKCGLCGKEVPEQPKITAEGKCSVCGAKLKPA